MIEKNHRTSWTDSSATNSLVRHISLDTFSAPLFKVKGLLHIQILLSLLFICLSLNFHPSSTPSSSSFILILFYPIYPSVCHLLKLYFVLLVFWQLLQSSRKDWAGVQLALWLCTLVQIASIGLPATICRPLDLRQAAVIARFLLVFTAKKPQSTKQTKHKKLLYQRCKN